MKFRPSLCLILLLITGFAYAQQVIPLYPGHVPGNLDDRNTEFTKQYTNGKHYVGNVTVPTLTVFRASPKKATGTAVIICPGGAYSVLSMESEGGDVCRSFADSGITAFLLKYRTFKDSTYTDYKTAPLDDLRQALRLVRQRSVDFGIDTTRIGLLGFSAGGHLVTIAANQKWHTAFTIPVYAVISFTDSLTSHRSASRKNLLGKDMNEALKVHYSGELNINELTPPAFIIHAQDDSTALVGNAVAYFDALTKKRIPAQLFVYEKGGHGFGSYLRAENERWFPSALKWLAVNGLYKTANAEQAVQGPPYWSDILSFKNKDSAQPVSGHPILFIGSSSFTRWKDVRDYFPGYDILNRGFGGSTLADVIRYSYDVIFPYGPKQVVIYCGENDIAAGVAVDEVVNRFKTLFGMIRQNLPGAEVSFVSMKPSPARSNLQDQMKEANKEIRAFLSMQKKAQFIDIYKSMLDAKGQMREELYVEDRLHMKPEGYSIWKKIITPYLLK